jgi:HSP20 family protein
MNRGNLFDDFFRDVAPGFYVKPLHGEPLPTPEKIKVDVKESDQMYTVQAEVPGVAKDDIHVKDEKVLRTERYYGAVSRSFQLPMEIDQSQAKAKYDNGVLTLTLPKKLSGGSQRLVID